MWEGDPYAAQHLPCERGWARMSACGRVPCLREASTPDMLVFCGAGKGRVWSGWERRQHKTGGMSREAIAPDGPGDHQQCRSVRFAPGDPGDAKRVRTSTRGVLGTPAMAHGKASRKQETQALARVPFLGWVGLMASCLGTGNAHVPWIGFLGRFLCVRRGGGWAVWGGDPCGRPPPSISSRRYITI